MEENSRPMKNISLVKLFARQFGVCEKCGYKYNLTVHHRNGNKEDDSFGNLGILCSKKYALWGLIKLRGCHTKMHIKMTVAAGENRLVISGTEYNLPLIGRFRLLIENWYRHKYVYKNNNGK